MLTIVRYDGMFFTLFLIDISLINNGSEKNLTPRAMNEHKYMNLNTLRMLLSMKREQRVAYIENSLFEIKLDKHDETKCTWRVYILSIDVQTSEALIMIRWGWLGCIIFSLFTIITISISLIPIDLM